MDIQFPLISFIIPTYNRQKILKRSVDSVLNQTYPNLELILIDDASEPGLEPYFLELKKRDNRVRYFINKKNQGVSFSRNIGLSQAKGEYVCFIDSDDFLSLDRVEAQRSFLQDNDLLVCDYFVENKYKDHLEVVSQNTEFDLLKRIVNRTLHLATLGIIWRREFLEKNSLKFDPLLRNSEDYLFIVQAILFQPRIHYLDQSLVTVVKAQHDSLTGNYQSVANTKNKLTSHKKVFFKTLGKISISDSLILLKKLIGFNWHILITPKGTS